VQRTWTWPARALQRTRAFALLSSHRNCCCGLIGSCDHQDRSAVKPCTNLTFLYRRYSCVQSLYLHVQMPKCKMKMLSTFSGHYVFLCQALRLCSAYPGPVLDGFDNDACCRANPFFSQTCEGATRPFTVPPTRLQIVSRKAPHLRIPKVSLVPQKAAAPLLHNRRGRQPFECGNHFLVRCVEYSAVAMIFKPLP